jgi:hypothetical protein
MRGFQRGAERIATQRYGEAEASVAMATAALDLLTAVAAEKRLDSGFLESIAH